MSMDANIQDDPTQPRPRPASQAQANALDQASRPFSPLPPTARSGKPRISRREFIGVSAIGLAGLGADTPMN